MSQRRTMVNGHENHFLNVRTFIGNGSARNVRLRNGWNFFFFLEFYFGAIRRGCCGLRATTAAARRCDGFDGSAEKKKKQITFLFLTFCG